MSRIILTGSRKYPSLPPVGPTPESHTKVLEALREAVQTHERRTSDRLSSFVRIQDLIDLGIVRQLDRSTIELLLSEGGSGGASALSDLTDVDLTGLADGDMLVWDEGAGLWVPQAPPSGGGALENVTPDTHPASPNALDDEFEAGSLNAKWTQFNSPTSVNFAQGALVLLTPNSGADNISGIEQTVAGNFKVRAKMTVNAGGIDNRFGLMVRDHVSGKLYVVGVFYSSQASFYVNHQPDFTGSGATNDVVVNFAQYVLAQGREWIYLEIEHDGTNLYFRASETGISGSFFLIGTVATATYLGTAPTRIGIYGSRGSVSATVVLADWFRGGF